MLLRSSFLITLRRNMSNRALLKCALVQCKVSKDRSENLANAAKLITEASSRGVEVVVLPECFNSPYGTKFFEEYAENVPAGPTCQMLADQAQKNGVHLIGGTIPERDDCHLYNTCTVWDPAGSLLAKYRKMHLFDIDIPGGITFKESDVLSSGDALATFHINGVKFGLGICYDMRFEELAKVYRLQGCQVLCYPGAFNMTTGPLHWELLQRGRALDNQVFIFGVSPARGQQGYIAWGHSQATDPWGKIIGQAGHGEEIVYVDLDLEECDKVRRQIPIYNQRRCDIYDTVLKTK